MAELLKNANEKDSLNSIKGKTEFLKTALADEKEKSKVFQFVNMRSIPMAIGKRLQV